MYVIFIEPPDPNAKLFMKFERSIETLTVENYNSIDPPSPIYAELFSNRLLIIKKNPFISLKKIAPPPF